MKKFKFDLDAKVYCESMGISGTVFSRLDCSDGSEQYRILGKDQTGSAKDEWIDESQLKKIGT